MMTSNQQSAVSDRPPAGGERHDCPVCGTPYIGTVVDGDCPVWDRAEQSFKIGREFPCVHCQIIVCWWQACSLDGDPVQHHTARLGGGYIRGAYYAAWLSRHARHLELELQEI